MEFTPDSKITVFCASSHEVDEIYFREAYEIGRLLAEANFHVFFGGGGKGLMATIADSVLENGGGITGIIPHFMVKKEWHHPNVTDMIYVENMAERKKLLIENATGILALPGSIGTFEEIMEVLSMKKLGSFFAPVVLLNTNNYFAPLITMLNLSITERFMEMPDKALWLVANNPTEALVLLKNNVFITNSCS